MKKIIIGLVVVLVGLVFMGCSPKITFEGTYKADIVLDETSTMIHTINFSDDGYFTAVWEIPEADYTQDLSRTPYKIVERKKTLYYEYTQPAEGDNPARDESFRVGSYGTDKIVLYYYSEDEKKELPKDVYYRVE